MPIYYGGRKIRYSKMQSRLMLWLLFSWQVLARLHTPTPARNDKAAPTKSAERDLI